MLSETGEAKLVDFGAAYEYSEQNNNRRNRIVLGTEAYLAPEVYKNCFSPKCDLWAIGILTIYLLFQDAKNLSSKNIQSVFIYGKLSDKCKDFISKLLVHDPNKRMSAKDALNHPWIKDYGYIGPVI